MTERPQTRQPSPGLNITPGDIYHILFRRKWMILAVSAAGIAGSFLVPLVKKVPYTSEAKLYIRYVLESSAPTPEANDPRIRTPDTRGENIINTELEILTSLDLAQRVADTIGPERILVGSGKRGRLAAAEVLQDGLTADVAKNSCVIRLAFRHRDPEIVQPVLQQLIEMYRKKHTEIHAVGAFDDFFTQETDQLRSDLGKTEQELGRARTNLGYYASLEDAKKFQGEQISRIRESILGAQAELAERKAAANELARLAHVEIEDATVGAAVANQTAHPSRETIAAYKQVSNQLDSLYKRVQEDSAVYTSQSAWMSALYGQISNAVTARAELERKNPELVTIGVTESRHQEPGNNPRADVRAETARISALSAKIAVLNEQLERLQKEAAAVGEAEGSIIKLQLQKEIKEGSYKHYVKGLEQARIDEKIGNGKVSNISPIQEPSPPSRDTSKLQKLRKAVALGGIIFAVGLAFVLEMFLDRSVKNPFEIEGKFGLPVYLTIPLISENGNGTSWFRNVPLLNRRNGNHIKALAPPGSDLTGEEVSAPEAIPSEFSSDNSELQLRPYFEALRDRLIGFFEIRNLTHKPKLVGITSCREGSGVSTFASGLAASLSETGDGNVLLVDMCQRNGAPQHFFGGHLNCGLDEVLDGEKRDGALVQENLYVVSESGSENGITSPNRLARILPKRFNNLMPKLKASDYDYIIFDMPQVGQLSVTPRIAKFMDIVLLVIESEKTDRDVVKRAVTLLAESKPSLGVVLNKRRTYVPKLLQPEI